MIRTAIQILKYRKTYFSQAGEDGVLEYILSKIPQKTKWCVEFGAWDGINSSNTHHFICKHHYKAVLIESDTEKFQQLQKNMKNRPQCICINSLVGIKGENSLKKILKKTSLPKEFDLISIDIDGNDYQIWKSLKEYNPAVVIIEINIRDKPHIKHINKVGSPFILGITGTSILSMTLLAQKKGYELVSQVGCNAIYVKSEYLKLFHQKRVSPADLFTYEGHRIYELSFREIQTLGYKKSFLLAIKNIKDILRNLYHKIWPH